MPAKTVNGPHAATQAPQQAQPEAFRDRIRELRRVPASELRANPGNWRRHPEGQLRALRGMLEQIGFAGAALAYEGPDGLTLIDGHARQELAADEEIPVLVLDLDEAEAKLLLATFDPLGAMAGTDSEALAALLAEVSVDQADLNAHLVSFLARDREGLTDPDEIPEPPVDPITKVGDLWQLGQHRLLCGDSSNPADVARLYGEVVAACVVTDPPYGIDHEGIAGDDVVGLPDLCSDVLKLLPIADAVVAAFQSPRMVTIWLDAVRETGHTIERLLWLHRASAKTFPWRGWVMASDAIVLSSFGRPAWPEPADFCHDTYEKTELEPDVMTGAHPTIKPSWIVEDIIRKLPAGPVLDPFAGSGTTLIAAERLGRSCMAMEIDPGYCDVVIERWQNFTGQEAVRIDE